MDITLLRIACRGLGFFEDNEVKVDFIAQKRVFGYEEEEGTVARLFNRVYKLNAIAFAGINASGKTTLMRLLSSLLKVYIGNGSLEYTPRIADLFGEVLEVEAFFYQASTRSVYRLCSAIAKDDTAQTLFFVSEHLYRKKADSELNRASVFEFSGDQLWMDRDRDGSAFLKREDSIFSFVMNGYEDAPSGVYDLCSITNHNWIKGVARELLVPLASYLDPSIESIELQEVQLGQLKKLLFDIKLRQRAEVLTVEPRDLELYLSSGTIKGISCFSAVAMALKQGGYVLIDEIENHLNKTIVISLINLFASELNKSGATLLFSTHYSEILDCLDRSDGVYLMSKDDAISVEKLSEAASGKDRKDCKKSELVMSGTLASAPSYQAYRELTKKLGTFLEGGAR